MQENKPIVKKKRKINLGIILLILGALLIIIAIGYEAASYPWGYKNASNDISRLPSPQPPSIGYQSYYAEDFASDTTPTTVPGSDAGTPLNRPNINLYHLGTLKIPRLSISENIFEGADAEILYGLGHVSGTPLPGEEGNFSVAGHRSYVWMHPFRHLDKLEVGDIVEVTLYSSDTPQLFTYEIYDSATVLPEDNWVMETRQESPQTITLITCTPIPSYSHRLVYWGKLIDPAPAQDQLAAE